MTLKHCMDVELEHYDRPEMNSFEDEISWAYGEICLVDDISIPERRKLLDALEKTNDI